MSLKTQSEAVPLVEATKLAIGCPVIFIGAVSVSEMKTTTSGRPETSRWSLASQVRQGTLPAKPTGKLGRPLNGTGLAGAEADSCKGCSRAAGACKLCLDAAIRACGDGSSLEPLCAAAG